MAKALTPKQERFVEEYLIDLNATQAAIRAGYSKKTAQEQSSRLLSNVMVQDAVSEAKKERSARTQIEADRVVQELAKIGFADIRRAVKWGATPRDPQSDDFEPTGLNIYPVALVPSHEIDDDTAAAISEVSLTQTGVKLKMHDKKSSLDSLGKHLGIFEKDNTQRAPVIGGFAIEFYDGNDTPTEG